MTVSSGGIYSRIAVGGTYSALAGIAAAAMAAIVKWGSHAFSTEILLVVRYGAGFVTFLVVCLAQRQGLPVRTSYPWPLFLVAFTWVGAVYCCYFAVRFIPLTDAVLLLYTSPIFAPLLNRLAFQKKEPSSVWLGVGLGFIGVIFILRPGADILHPQALIGLLAGFLLAVRLVINSALAKKESKEVITFYSLALAWLICLGALAVTGFTIGNWERHLFPPRDWFHPWIIFPSVLLAAVSLGVLSMLQPWFTTVAYEYASVGQASPFRYFGVIFAGIVDWLLWGHVPDLPSVLGFLFITAGVVWVIIHEGKK